MNIRGNPVIQMSQHELTHTTIRRRLSR